MSHVIAMAFPKIDAADAVLGRLRSLQAEHLLELEDACVAQRDRGGHLHLKQAIGHRLGDALPGHFWHRIAAQIFHPNHDGPAENGNGATLSADFVEQVSRTLQPEMSALLILVGEGSLDPLTESLRGHEGTIIRAELPEVERSKLGAALSGVLDVPSAADLATVAEEAEERERSKRSHDRKEAETARRRLMMRLEHEPLSPHDLHHVIETCRHAARQGREHALVMRFPAELCTDGGRAINNDDDAWPATLVGQPRDLYDYWNRTLRPRGYRITAAILDFPGGMPGDAGLTLHWENPGSASH
jgi:uncharacterized membrane protein